MAAIVSGESKKSATTSKFLHFDVVSDESDHYYVKSNRSSKDKKCFIDTNTSAYRTIMKEWKILEKHLPESIYVRTYESRMDLLRAVIVGAAGTPYHDGLFFFDIVFPSDYPKQPPKVRYLSRGYHMNPNLYPDGYGLVLNAQPYFNEPGHEYYIKDEVCLKASLTYNEEVFILTCKTMLSSIRTPPKNFEGIVYHQYFRVPPQGYIVCSFILYFCQRLFPRLSTKEGGAHVFLLDA
ncbi:putative DELLA protein RGL1-like [Capsicum annuum]|nr:putative DELLA protein RGL1-like [Capsicum annuum]